MPMVHRTTHRSPVALALLLTALGALTVTVHAAPWTGGMLYSRFGVVLDIEQHTFSAGHTVYRFSNDWTPTPNPLTYAKVEYIVNDHYAYPSTGSVIGSEPAERGGHVVNDPRYTTPTWPAGGEPYDVEAIYMTNDEANVYIAIVTSNPPPPGKTESASSLGVVTTGDLAIHTASQEYDYGVDINRADRARNTLVPAPLPTTVGTGLYNTTQSNWYATNAANAVTAVSSPHTNFYGAGMSASKLGDVTVSYLNTELREGYDVTLAPGDYSQLSTWEVNITLPISMLPVYDDMSPGETRYFGVSFMPGCRNDGNSSKYAIRLDGSITQAPEPGTLALLGLGLLGLFIHFRKREKQGA